MFLPKLPGRDRYPLSKEREDAMTLALARQHRVGAIRRIEGRAVVQWRRSEDVSPLASVHRLVEGGYLTLSRLGLVRVVDVDAGG